MTDRFWKMSSLLHELPKTTVDLTFEKYVAAKAPLSRKQPFVVQILNHDWAYNWVYACYYMYNVMYTMGYACIYIYVYIYVYVCILICVYIYIYIYVCICMYVYLYIYIYIQILNYTLAATCTMWYIYMYICIYICLYIYIYIHGWSGEGLEETWIHQKIAFCIFGFQSILAGIPGNIPSFRILSGNSGENLSFRLYKRENAHAL